MKSYKVRAVLDVYDNGKTEIVYETEPEVFVDEEVFIKWAKEKAGVLEKEVEKAKTLGKKATVKAFLKKALQKKAEQIKKRKEVTEKESNDKKIKDEGLMAILLGGKRYWWHKASDDLFKIGDKREKGEFAGKLLRGGKTVRIVTPEEYRVETMTPEEKASEAKKAKVKLFLERTIRQKKAKKYLKERIAARKAIEDGSADDDQLAWYGQNYGDCEKVMDYRIKKGLEEKKSFLEIISSIAFPVDYMNDFGFGSGIEKAEEVPFEILEKLKIRDKRRGKYYDKLEKFVQDTSYDYLRELVSEVRRFEKK